MPLTYTMLGRLPQEPLTLTEMLHHLPSLNQIKGDLVELSLVPLSFHKDGPLIKMLGFFLLQCAHYKGETCQMFPQIKFSRSKKKKKCKINTYTAYFSYFLNLC